MRPVIPTSARGFRPGFGLIPCARRHVHATPWVSKSVKQKITEAADKVNKKVGEGLATAIETGETATERTKETLATKHAKGKAEGAKEGVDRVVQKANSASEDVVSGAKEAGKKQKDL
ncbi:hypothetical protein EV363DRAFT_315930 [Boletus edulis]|nr:hypothetical protein EV363DRAFT_315930 [Boletus edulis]